MKNLITLEKALNTIKISIEEAITKSGTTGKNNLIRTQKPIKLLHDVVKAELIKNGVNKDNIAPPYGESHGELPLAGYFKRKNQDICIIPKNVKTKEEILNFSGILKGKKDNYGKEFTEKCLSINVRSQLSSSAKNFDTLYERTFAEALNLHLRCPKMVLGEFYMIAVREYDSNKANRKIVEYRKAKIVHKHIAEYLLSFDAINNRKSIDDNHFTYEKICLLIVDFSFDKPKIYNTDSDLKKDNLLKEESFASIKNLNFNSFVKDLLKVYSERFRDEVLS